MWLLLATFHCCSGEDCPNEYESFCAAYLASFTAVQHFHEFKKARVVPLFTKREWPGRALLWQCYLLKVCVLTFHMTNFMQTASLKFPSAEFLLTLGYDLNHSGKHVRDIAGLCTSQSPTWLRINRVSSRFLMHDRSHVFLCVDESLGRRGLCA